MGAWRESVGFTSELEMAPAKNAAERLSSTFAGLLLRLGSEVIERQTPHPGITPPAGEATAVQSDPVPGSSG